ncbi:MAG: carbohydrate ABC transporter permease [Treponema sp.]|jgi:multiple sugar transport system permease protein/putative aldouronate transport system permease protein|nr:carbohydrate ABC transporter permease [Treponema sp.]
MRGKTQSSIWGRFTAGDKWFHVVCLFWLGLSGLSILYPLVYVLACSFSSAQAILRGDVVLWPVEFSLAAYKSVFNYPLLRSGFFNSLLYVAGGTVVGVSVVLLTAYPLSRKDLPFRKFFQTFFVVTMFFSGGMIPSYLLMRNLHLVGTRWALIIGAGFSCYNMIIVKTYFQSSLPPGILDAAHIDGCGDVRFFFTIALPLAVPVIAVIVLFDAVSIWNGYFNGMLYLTKANTFNFQMILRDILFVAQMPVDMLNSMDSDVVENLQNILQQLRYSVLVVGALPMMILYPFIQKYFIRGMMIGSLKE